MVGVLEEKNPRDPKYLPGVGLSSKAINGALRRSMGLITTSLSHNEFTKLERFVFPSLREDGWLDTSLCERVTSEMVRFIEDSENSHHF